MIQIVVTGEKGGVGKSTIACLLTEWFLHKGNKVRVVDADPNETTREWIEACADEGRVVSTEQGTVDYRVVDTAGRSGSGMKYVHEADLLLAPFQPLNADVSRVVSWFMALHERLQRKVLFIPNRLRALGLTKEQQAGLDQIKKLVEHEGNGTLLPAGLIDRLAVYPVLFDGSSENFFTNGVERSDSWKKAQEEADHLFQKVFEYIEPKS